MRRALVIGFAVLIVMIAARGVMAQDAEQSATDRLLEILKSRQIISEGEYSELKELAGNMEAERSEVDTRLNALDRSISDYLAKDGEGVGSNVTYQPGSGFTFGSSDNAFSLTVGGTFIMHYLGLDINDVSGSKDTNNFNITENRIHFAGHAFDPAMGFYIEFDAAPQRQASFMGVPADQAIGSIALEQIMEIRGLQAAGLYLDEPGTTRLWEAYINYEVCDWMQVRAGQMKVPYGRQWMTHVGDLGFAERDIVSDYFDFGRDVGVMLHDHLALGDSEAIFQYNLFIGNGEGNIGNDHSYVAWAIRGAIDPFGLVEYSEGDFSGGDFRASLGGTYYEHQMRFDTAKITAYEIDFAAKWMGFYLIAEWFNRDISADSFDGDIKTDGWYAQLQYQIIPKQLEVMARFGNINWDTMMFSEIGENIFDLEFEDTEEWAVGLAWYFSESHAWKTVLEFGGVRHKVTETTSDQDPSFNFLRLAIQLQW